jgi:hypothetical protein
MTLLVVGRIVACQPPNEINSLDKAELSQYILVNTLRSYGGILTRLVGQAASYMFQAMVSISQWDCSELARKLKSDPLLSMGNGASSAHQLT